MKRNLIWILIIGFAFALGFYARSIFDNRLNTNIQAGEVFEDFIFQFDVDSAFQTSRILFPLIKHTLDSKTLEEISIKINKTEWNFTPIWGNQSYFIQIVDIHETAKLRENNQKILAFRGIENGINLKYYFEKRQRKWFLVRIEDFST